MNVDKCNLWIALNDCLAIWSEVRLGKRKVLINRGEIVEFRYHDPINFRTIDNNYFKMDKKDFYSSFQPYGNILEDIRFNNVATLEEILRLKLFNKIKAKKK